MRTACASFLLCLASFVAAAERADVTADEQAIIEQTNAQRRTVGQSELRTSATLCAVARKHAAAMARANRLDHRLNGKSSGDRVTAAGYKWTTVSENIAWNQRSVPEVMDGWMRSDGHRTNLLGNDITEMGAGIAQNSKGEFYFVQVFARPDWAVKFATLKFEIHNTSAETMKVDVRVGKLFVLKPGESAKYTLTTPSPEPSVSVGGGGRAMEFKVQNGGDYSLAMDGGRIQLVQSIQEAPRTEMGAYRR